MVAPVLLLVDIQKGFDDPVWGARNNPDAEVRAAALLKHWRAAGAPVIHVRHQSAETGSPLAPDHPGNAIKDEVAPVAGELVIEKSVNSAFIGTDLLARLQQMDAHALVICGLTTPHCISSTARMAANLGFEVCLAEDACAAFTSNANVSWKPGAAPPDAELIHDQAVAHLHGEFLRAVQTADLLAQPL